MEIEDKILELITYYRTTKGKGHTTLVKQGTENYNGKKLVLCKNHTSGIVLGFKPNEIISWDRIEKLRGNNKPLVIDNYTMIEMLEEMVRKISELELELDEANRTTN